MRVDRNNKLLALSHVCAEVLDLISKDIGGGHLYRGGEVENDRLVLRGSPGSLHSLADLHGVLGLGIGESLGGELELPICASLRGVVLGDGAGVLCAFDSHLQTLLVVHVEDDATETGARCEVDVEDSLLGALQGIDCAADEILAAGGQDLQGDIVGCETGLFYQTAGKVEVRLGCGGEGDLDFLVTNIHEHLEETVFLLAVLWNQSNQYGKQ